jgi:RNA polymerase sigma-B factor
MPSVNERVSRVGDTRYDEVQQMFCELSELADGSREYRRLRERIIELCLPLADNVARRYRDRGQSHEDLVQVARMGLLNAVNRYDPAGGDFLAFAVPTVMGEVKRYFRDYGWDVKVPRRLKDLYPQLAPVMSEMSQRLGRAPTPSELSAEVGVDRAEVVEALIAGAGFKARSLDVRGDAGDDSSPTLADRLGALDPSIRFIEDREALRVELATLSSRERTIIVLRFFEGLTQDEIARRIGVSQMHVSRLLARALGALRQGIEGSTPLPKTGTG